MKRRIFALLSAAVMVLPMTAMLTACGEIDSILLRVYNWEEYIDEGGEGSYEYDYEVNEDGSAPSLVEDFEAWYEETYGTPVTVEYSTFGTNEDMYNQLKLGYTYDLEDTLNAVGLTAEQIKGNKALHHGLQKALKRYGVKI